MKAVDDVQSGLGTRMSAGVAQKLRLSSLVAYRGCLPEEHATSTVFESS